MLIKAKIPLAVAIIFSTAFATASAATKHHRPIHLSPAIAAPNNISVTTQCLPSDSPCRKELDSW